MRRFPEPPGQRPSPPLWKGGFFCPHIPGASPETFTGFFKRSADRPVFFRNECLNFSLPVAENFQGSGLNSSGAEPPSDFSPEKRTDLIAYQPVENTPRLLCVHQSAVDFPRFFHGFFYRVFRDFIEFHTAYRIFIDAEKIRDMPLKSLPPRGPGRLRD